MIEISAYTANMNLTEILKDGVDWLRQKFGDVGTELFVSLIIREKFDYARWRRQYFGEKTVSQDVRTKAFRFHGAVGVVSSGAATGAFAGIASRDAAFAGFARCGMAFAGFWTCGASAASLVQKPANIVFIP